MNQQNLLDGLSNSVPAVRLYREGRATGNRPARRQKPANHSQRKNHVRHHPIRPGRRPVVPDDRQQSECFPHREPEQRLWKLFSQTVSPKFAMIELFVFMLFLVITVIGIISCFAELSSLLQKRRHQSSNDGGLERGRVIRIAVCPAKVSRWRCLFVSPVFERRQEDL